MCGISGLINFREPPSGGPELERMLRELVHRGPDGVGVYASLDGAVRFGTNRLAIVDPANGAQPLAIEHGAARYAITYNGEVYNHRDLRSRLEDAGHRFRTQCDTEVVLRAYVEWGQGCVERFNGQFAFGIYDGKNREVFLARDRLGIKPLFHARLRDGTVAFASEPKAILTHPGITPEADPRTLTEYLVCSNILPNGCPPLDASFYLGIAALPPGATAVVAADGMTVTRYYDLPHEPRVHDPDAPAKLRDAVSTAIRTRVPTEAPFGVLLSGGLDSSVVAAVLARDGYRFPCVTINYEGQENPDLDSARVVAAALGQELIAPALTPDHLVGLVDPLVRAMDGPHDALRHLGLSAAYRAMREAGAKVAIVGEGSDEFNLGYYWSYPGHGVGTPPLDRQGFREMLRGALGVVQRWLAPGFAAQADGEEIIERQVEVYYEANLPDHLDRVQRYYSRKFLKYRLDANDTCGMAHGVEGRVPYCDHGVAARCLRVPHADNLEGGSEKVVLRRAFADLLPPDIAARRKYAIPNCERLLLGKRLVDLLAAQAAVAPAGFWEVVNRDHVTRLVANVRQAVDRLERAGSGGRDLIEDASVTHRHHFTTKSVFTMLTLLRWYCLTIARSG